MSSVGVFCQKDINGKPFHIISFVSKTDNSSSFSTPLPDEEAIDSGGDSGPSLPTRFFCPRLRADGWSISGRANNVFKRVRCPRLNVFPLVPPITSLSRSAIGSTGDDGIDDGKMVPISISPHFNKETVDQLVLLHKARPWKTRCKHPLLPLFWCNNQKPTIFSFDFVCGVCEMPEVGSGCYLCETCENVYHKECVEAPVFIKKHPSYPSLSLRLYILNLTVGKICIFCETQILQEMAYYCPIYKVISHVFCALEPIPITVDQFKRHPHPLTLFPKQASLACDICGTIKELIPTYICARCVFVVHEDCISFPYVIRISRHHHRISFTYSLPSGKLSCGVCRRKVDNSCGAYSCNNCDGSYFVHSRCALREDLWDGEELEGIPEEIDIVEDPFEKIADGIILHFSHGHHLKLEICGDYNEDKYCQVCVLPIYEGNYYSCVEDHCDFILHETCASAPRKIRHPLHARPLTLKVVTSEYDGGRGVFYCSACMRRSNGFVYEDESTEHMRFRLDVRCASISEPFKYENHEHPLFLALTPSEAYWAKCHICNNRRHQNNKRLNCIECDYIICFRCATLPYKAKYKHDKHFLTFRKELVETDQSDWCEACEEKIVYSGEFGFYACDEYCCTTLHVDCLLGEDPYLKHGDTISDFGRKFHILRNNTMSRPFCHSCKKLCPHRVVFQLEHPKLKHWIGCSTECLAYSFLLS